METCPIPTKQMLHRMPQSMKILQQNGEMCISAFYCKLSCNLISFQISKKANEHISLRLFGSAHEHRSPYSPNEPVGKFDHHLRMSFRCLSRLKYDCRLRDVSGQG